MEPNCHHSHECLVPMLAVLWHNFGRDLGPLSGRCSTTLNGFWAVRGCQLGAKKWGTCFEELQINPGHLPVAVG